MPIDPDEIDDWFPTLVRIIGIISAIALIMKTLFFGGVEYPSLYVFVTGMILYKEVVRSRRGTDKKRDDNDERRNNLP